MIISGILGHPLKKPRSIKIWKEYFRRKNILSKMLKFEVAPKNLKNFFNYLKKEKKFKAMAVTMPYKKTVIRFIDNLDQFAKMAGAINLIIKKKNKLFGYNTDVYGAFISIKKYLRNYNSIVIIGLGGTGQAIFNFLMKKYKKKNYFLVSSKFNIAKKKENIKISKKIPNEITHKKILIINCTPLGSNLKKKFKYKTPIEIKLLEKIKKNSIIFDIIYSPKVTKLSKDCKKCKLKYFNGIKMNTLQAERALKLAFGY